MVFMFLSLRAADESPDPLYPNPGAATNSIALEEGDGAATTFPAEAVRTAFKPIGEEEIQTNELGDLKALVWVTDCRVAFACTHPLNGGGFGGEGAIGLTAAIAANVITRAVAHSRTAGQSLVGHVRYEWLVGAIARDRRGWGDANKLQIFVRDPEQADMFDIIMIQLPKNTAASPIAELIAAKAARFQAEKTDDASKRASLLTYAQRPTSDVVAQTKARIFMLPTK